MKLVATDMEYIGAFLKNAVYGLPEGFSIEYLVLVDRNGDTGTFVYDSDEGELVANVAAN